MSIQAVDKNGAADYLQLSLTTINARISKNSFPKPDIGAEWWSIDSLDKYKRSLAAQKAAQTRRRNRKKK